MKILVKKTQGGGHTNITLCTGTEGSTHQSISFGSNQAENICGKIDGNNSHEKISGSLSLLFQKQWDNGSSSGNSQSNSSGSAQCVNSGSGGTIDQTGNSEYLGYCEKTRTDSSNSDSYFLKIEKQNTQVQKLEVCSNNCGQSQNSTGNTITTYTSPNSTNGKEIKFSAKQ